MIEPQGALSFVDCFCARRPGLVQPRARAGSLLGEEQLSLGSMRVLGGSPQLTTLGRMAHREDRPILRMKMHQNAHKNQKPYLKIDYFRPASVWV